MLAGYSPWDLKESDTTERLSTQHTYVLSTGQVEMKDGTPALQKLRIYQQTWEGLP